jgi:hypothetical protein
MAEHLNKTTFQKFGGPMDKMTTGELELELEIIKSAVSFLDDAQLDRKLWDATGTYRDRIRDLENEIFERGVLV